MTSDPDAAQDFYTKVVGWSTTKFEPTTMDYTLFMAGETPAGGVMATPDEAKAMNAPPSWIAYVEVPDVDATAAETAQSGGRVVSPPRDIPNIGRFAILADPQGATFAVITSSSQIGEENDPRQGEFSWHELATTDDVGAVDFYQKLFGWESKSHFDMGEMGTYHMFGRDRFTYGGMMKMSPGMPGPYWLHYAQVDSADAAAERAKEAGGNVILGPMEVPGGDRIAVMTDPQGAAFAVHSKHSAG